MVWQAARGLRLLCVPGQLSNDLHPNPDRCPHHYLGAVWEQVREQGERNSVARAWPMGREGDAACDKEPGATLCKTQGWCLGVRDHTSPEPPAPTTLPHHRWEAQGLPSALAANYGSLWDGILDNSVLWCALRRDKLI